MKINIAMCLDDDRYINAFKDYVAKHEKDSLVVHGFTDPKQVCEFILHNKPDLIVLYDEFIDVADSFGEIPVAILTSDKYVKDDGRFDYIFRFQTGYDIIRQIYKIIASKDIGQVKKCTVSGNVEVIGVFSPCFPDEREEYARYLAEYYEEMGKTLFVDLSEFSLSEDGDGKGLSELIYYLDNEREINPYLFKSVLNEGNKGFWEIAKASCYKDIWDMTTDNIKDLMSCIINCGDFKYIILDIGLVGLSDPVVFSECNRILMPAIWDSERNKKVIDDIKKTFLKDISDRLEKISLGNEWYRREEYRYNWVCNYEDRRKS